jgi:transcription antitermination protein NusB
MSSNRHLARVVALQTLYEYEFRTRADIEGLTSDVNEILDRNIAVYKDSLGEEDFVRDITMGAMKHREDADAMIAPAAPEWPLDQIAKMDLTILRLAIYELMIKREVPPKVVINEAVELAKSFGGENSSRFINGVLGTIYRQSEFYDPTEDHKIQREREAGEGKKASSQRSASGEKAEHAAASELGSSDSTDGNDSAEVEPTTDAE